VVEFNFWLDEVIMLAENPIEENYNVIDVLSNYNGLKRLTQNLKK
jgi:hypothetical protein